MTYHELLKLFQEFDTYHKNNRIPATSKVEHLKIFVRHKAALLEVIAQLVNERTEQHIYKQAYDCIDTKTLDFMRKYMTQYFNLERNRVVKTSSPAKTIKPAPAPIV